MKRRDFLTGIVGTVVGLFAGFGASRATASMPFMLGLTAPDWPWLEVDFDPRMTATEVLERQAELSLRYEHMGRRATQPMIDELIRRVAASGHDIGKTFLADATEDLRRTIEHHEELRRQDRLDADIRRRSVERERRRLREIDRRRKPYTFLPPAKGFKVMRRGVLST